LLDEIGSTFDMLRAFLLMHPEGDAEAVCDEAERQIREAAADALREGTAPAAMPLLVWLHRALRYLQHDSGCTRQRERGLCSCGLACLFDADAVPPEVEQAAAPLVTPEGAQGWQPIETALKDGSIVLGFEPHEDNPIDIMRWKDGAWRDPDTWEVHPTHWMPLPLAPSSPADTEQTKNDHEVA
jgi:hypothetical protein